MVYFRPKNRTPFGFLEVRMWWCDKTSNECRYSKIFALQARNFYFFLNFGSGTDIFTMVPADPIPVEFTPPPPLPPDWARRRLLVIPLREWQKFFRTILLLHKSAFIDIVKRFSEILTSRLHVITAYNTIVFSCALAEQTGHGEEKWSFIELDRLRLSN